MALLASASLTAFVAPISAAPNEEAASSSVTTSHSVIGPADEGPTGHFAFSVLDQASTTQTKAVGGGTTIQQNTATTFRVTQSVPPGTTISPNAPVMVDFVNPNFVVNFAGPSGTGAINGAPGVPGYAGNCTISSTTTISGGTLSPAQQVLCNSSANPANLNTTIAQWDIIITIPSTVAPGTVQSDQVCSVSPGNTATNCENPLTVTVVNNPAVNTPTPTATATVTNTPVATTTATATPTRTATPAVGVPPTPPVSGTPGVPCATAIGQTCTATGAVTGTWSKTGSGVFTFTATGPANALVGGVPTVFIPTTANANGEQFPCTATTAALTTTCTGTTAGDPLQGAVITVAFPLVGGGFGTVTGTITSTNFAQNLTLAAAQTQAQATAGFLLGTPGVPCATLGSALAGQVLVPGINQTAVGQTCTVTGAVTGTLTRTGSMSFTLNTTVPAGVPAGITPVAVFSTDLGIQAVACAAVTGAAGSAYTCTGTITGNALQGSTVALCFTAATACLLGTITGPGPVVIPNNLPLLPPPPLQFIPPPPPPLLPPPPPAPMGTPSLAAPPGGIPVIPEADSLFLVVGGLVALGGLVGLRSLRRRRDDEA